MAEYLVTWTIDIEAGSPRQAAECALKIQRDPESTATVFKVARWSGRRISKSIKQQTYVNEVEIDLGKEDL